MKNIIILALLLSLCCCKEVRAQIVNQLLFSKTNGVYAMWDGTLVKTMGYSTTLSANIDLPSPTLVYNQGDSVKLTLWNKSQGAPHTIHLHGLDVDQQNDGVPQLSFTVHHDEKKDYHFVAPHAGTYIYHCHVVSTVHVQGGMYGMIIVRPTNGSTTQTWDNGYTYDQDMAWMMSEVDTTWHHDTIINHTHDTSQTTHTLPTNYTPQYFLVNGKSEQQLSGAGLAVNANVNEKIYLRLANIGYYGNRIVLPSALNTKIISSDGRPLPNLEQSDTVMLFPGERYGLLLEATGAITDSIQIEYFDLNTQAIQNTQNVPVQISGTVAVAELSNEQPSISCSVWPNPANTQVHLNVALLQSELLNGELLDINGRMVHQFSTFLAKGNTSLTLPITELGTGVYFLKLKTSAEQLVKKLIVEH
ncbi:MAG: multicopper oxidase domain-containing protein [Aureispira sp.]|nr:multicopper oxidase domain-containing protein [Aureispira sp.]